jgi:glutamine amidotransferase
MIAVIDYGMGNLRSVEKALERVGAKVKVTSRPKDIAVCDKLVLPGVGAFGDAMRELKKLRLVEPIKDAIKEGKQFLGLCLGMQLLFDKSDEAPGVKGLGMLEGEVKRFNFSQYTIRNTPYAVKVPHMGWNSIDKNSKFKVQISKLKIQISKLKAQNSKLRAQSRDILKAVEDGAYVYFVHSYYVVPKDKNIILTTTDYSIRFASGICKDNVYGFQFHPEKSQDTGLKILKNFIKLK